MPSKTMMIHGNTACAEAAIMAGCRFFAGYPITPSSEIAEYLAYKLPLLDGIFIQMEDEIASICAVIGASIAGLKAMTATSGPGFSLMQENIGFACIAEIPCVIVDVQRGGPSTGLPTLPSQQDVMQSRWGTHGEHPIIVLTPSSASETFHLTIKAFNLSEKFRVPVILLTDEITAHLTEKVTIPDKDQIKIINRKKPAVPPEKYIPYQIDDTYIPAMANFGDGYRYHITGLVRDEQGFPTNDPEIIEKQLIRLNQKLEKYRNEIIEYDTQFTEDFEKLVICYGSPYRAAKNAVTRARDKGIKVGLIKLKTLWPFPGEEIKPYTAKAKKIIIPEMNLGQVAYLIKSEVCDDDKIIKINKINGEPITPEEIYKTLIWSD
ncbi:MAG: 2-oxoacid:acceptor oxidoreductase subunit alpha [Candidatus Marinimicrobia bacterium]|nr:2-oxoacid:acceptor oxidoreductase subunit alpha [Candidatus Neomarinimicrobiota bacterium]